MLRLVGGSFRSYACSTLARVLAVAVLWKRLDDAEACMVVFLSRSLYARQPSVHLGSFVHRVVGLTNGLRCRLTVLV